METDFCRLRFFHRSLTQLLLVHDSAKGCRPAWSSFWWQCRLSNEVGSEALWPLASRHGFLGLYCAAHAPLAMLTAASVSEVLSGRTVAHSRSQRAFLLEVELAWEAQGPRARVARRLQDSFCILSCFFWPIYSEQGRRSWIIAVANEDRASAILGRGRL